MVYCFGLFSLNFLTGINDYYTVFNVTTQTLFYIANIRKTVNTSLHETI